MARAYIIATAAVALSIPVKWVDNVLSHNRIAGVTQARQGVSRRLSIEGLLALYLILLLTNELGMTQAVAIQIATELVAGKGGFVTPGMISIHLDLDAHRHRLLSKLEHAVE